MSIYVRKKQPTLWMEDLNDIVNKIDNNEFKPENILPYLIAEKNNQVEQLHVTLKKKKMKFYKKCSQKLIL